MADQIKEQEPKQTPPEDTSSSQQSPAPSQPDPTTPPPDKPGQDDSEKKKGGRRTSVFIYLVVLFAAAFTMLFMAYLMQQRANDAAISSLQDSLTSFESIDELLNENQVLRGEYDALEEQAAKLEEQLQQAQDSADSWQQQYEDQAQQWKDSQADARIWQALWRIEYSYREGDLEACAEQYTMLSSSDDYAPPEEGEVLSRFREIFDELVEEGYLDGSLRTSLFPEQTGN